jgi:hypothetical protein
MGTNTRMFAYKGMPTGKPKNASAMKTTRKGITYSSLIFTKRLVIFILILELFLRCVQDERRGIINLLPHNFSRKRGTVSSL